MRSTPDSSGDTVRHSGKGLLRDRRGAVGAWSALILVMLLGVAALTLDMGFLWVLRDRLQSTADAAALAGASQLTTTPDPASVKAEAAAYAQKNMSTGGHGTVLADADVVLGHWHGKDHHAPGDPDLRTFVTNATGTAAPVGETTNAVKATTRRAEANGNAASLFLASVLGIRKADVVAQAIAQWEGGVDDCFEQGIMAGNLVLLDEDADITSNYCIFGRNGVSVYFGAFIEDGSRVGALDRNNVWFRPRDGQCVAPICVGDPPDGPEPGPDPGASYSESSLISADYRPTLAGVYGEDVPPRVEAILDYLENPAVNPRPEGFTWPSQITSVEVLGALPAILTEGTAYIINGPVTIDTSYNVRNVLIAARGDVKFNGGGIQNPDSCLAGRKNIGVLATRDIIDIGSASFAGVDLIAGRDVTITPDLQQVDVGIQAGRNVWIDNQDPDFAACENAQSAFDPQPKIWLVN